ncbi:hypothetical protein H0H81_012104 [Sphagnurus paluster]|uniref:Charged multivesicular body protein 6 n=1 Tax=Sphagnurus paluster TaxID=117069 RepID=A0A9P7GMY2_9AGAR|nr:hypothetical protein H0H81_012104 [Sphagnurus paluster]
MSVLHGLRQGNEVLKEIHKEMSIESVEKLLEETSEAREYQKEIGEMLSNTLTLDEEDVVQAELKALQAEQLQESEISQPMEMPTVPVTIPVNDPAVAESTKPPPAKIPVYS